MAYDLKLAEQVRAGMQGIPFVEKKHARPFAITGKPMKGWLLVEARGTKSTKQISDWIKEAVEFASTLPPK